MYVGHTYIYQGLQAPLRKKKLLCYLCSSSPYLILILDFQENSQNHFDRMARCFFLKSPFPIPPIQVGPTAFIQLPSLLTTLLPGPSCSLIKGTSESHLQAEGSYLQKNQDQLEWKLPLVFVIMFGIGEVSLASTLLNIYALANRKSFCSRHLKSASHTWDLGD